MKTIEPCPTCGGDMLVHTGQAIHRYDGTLIWSQHMRCDACGTLTEGDGSGFPPERYRDSMLAEYGTWNAAITSDSPKQRIQAALVLKEIFELNTKEAFHLVKGTPRAVFTGTDIEAEWVCSRLRLGGVECAIEPATPAKTDSMKGDPLAGPDGGPLSWEMKTIEPCSRCGRDVTVHTVQRLHGNDQPTWSQGIHCGSCGAGLEADGRGMLPSPYCGQVLAERGTWHAALISDSPEDRMRAALALKAILELSTSEAFQLVKRTPRALFSGTEIDAEWVCRRLRLGGVKCRIEQ
jgi:hypothetical protein